MTFTCICEREIQAEVPESIDLDASPEYRGAILDGSFLTFACPACEKVHKVEFALRLVWPSKGQDIHFIPESERMLFYRGKKKVPDKAQCVIGYPELLERIRILEAALNPAAVEIMKYIYQTKAEEANPDSDIKVYFHDYRDGALSFHVLGVSKDEIALIKAPKSMYDLALADLPNKAKTAPFKDFLSPPYVSVRSLDLEE
jgi:hypothetical protein